MHTPVIVVVVNKGAKNRGVLEAGLVLPCGGLQQVHGLLLREHIAQGEEHWVAQQAAQSRALE